MTELDMRRSPWNEGLSIPWEVVALDLYRLACIFHASLSIESSGGKGIVELRRQFQEREIGQLLIAVASVMRNAEDQNPRRADYWRHLLGSDVVGTLIPNLKILSKAWPLSFREACNKILHCSTLNFEYRSDRPRRGIACCHKCICMARWATTIGKQH